MDNLSTEPYKGVRDFYPEEWAKVEFVFNQAEIILKKYHYQKYNASPLEELDLYLAKSSDEIKDQLFTFLDKGGRNVALRPEMTQTLARMIARKTNLKFPLRWYSIPNVFRYEKTQKGRKREHYQINADFWSETNSIEIDKEIITIANEIIQNFNLKNGSDYKIIINDRLIFNDLMENVKIPLESWEKIIKLFDKKDKITNQIFNEELIQITNEEQAKEIIKILKNPEILKSHNLNQLKDFQKILNFETEINLTMIRGAEYYNGIIFEIIGLDDEKEYLSLIGGGRYNNILALFNDKRIAYPSGFGLGEYRIIKFLESKNFIFKKGQD